MKKTKFDYKWVIVALCFLMVFTTLGFCSSPRSLFVRPVTEHLQIDRTVYSFVDSLRFISTAVVNIFFGFLVAKFGAKKLISAGFSLLIASMLIYSLSNNIILFYLGGIFLGAGLSFTCTTMVGYVVNKWAKSNKGTIMGAALAANGLGGAIAVQIVSPIIEKSSTGYKNAYLLVAVILFAVGILIVAFFKNEPKNSEAVAEKTETNPKKKRGMNADGLEFSEILRKPYFYVSVVCVFLTGVILQGIHGIAAVHMQDVGLDKAFVTTTLSIGSLSLAGFKFITGFVYDKFGLRLTSNTCSTAAIVVMVSLSLVTNSTLGMLLAVVYAAFSGLALPLETIMLPIYAGDLYGQRSYNKVLGIFVSANTAGYAVGTPVANLVFDLVGSYKAAIVGSAILMAVVVLTMQFVISIAHNEIKKAEEKEIQDKAQIA